MRASYFNPGGLYKGMHEDVDAALNLPWCTSMQSRLRSLFCSYIFQKPKAPSFVEVASGKRIN